MKKLLILGFFASVISGCVDGNSNNLLIERDDLNIAPIANTSSPLNNWKVACSGRKKIDPNRGVDRGAIEYIKLEDTWKFTPSRNYCSGGAKQRAELATGSIKTNTEKSYLFETNISFKSQSTERFIIFSIHDGRDGCAPPASLYVSENGQLYVESDIKTGPGESCIRGRLGQASKDKVSKDGRNHNLRIFVEFDGVGGFIMSVWLDGKLQINGGYIPQTDEYASTRFYFKHGVYSQKMFNYVLKSKNRRVAEIVFK